MAPLSHDLAGLILPHDHFGSHLNGSLNCIDDELEKKNFQKAGEVLSEVWSNIVIDGEAVVAKYIQPKTYSTSIEQSEEWKSTHVRASQYLLQVVKCGDLKCCKLPRSTISSVLPNRFLPAPVLFCKNETGVAVADIGDATSHFGSLQTRALLSSLLPVDLPFDYYCPSVQSSLESRQCKTCSVYHCSLKALQSHRRHGCLANVSTVVEEFVVEIDFEEDDFGDTENNDLDSISVPIWPLEQFLCPLFEDNSA